MTDQRGQIANLQRELDAIRAECAAEIERLRRLCVDAAEELAVVNGERSETVRVLREAGRPRSR